MTTSLRKACGFLLSVGVLFSACTESNHRLTVENQTERLIAVIGFRGDESTGYGFVEAGATSNVKVSSGSPPEDIWIQLDAAIGSQGEPAVTGGPIRMCAFDDAKAVAPIVVTNGALDCEIPISPLDGSFNQRTFPQSLVLSVISVD